MSGGDKERDFLCRRCQDIDVGLRVVPGCTVGDHGNISKDGPGDECLEVQYHSLRARVHMGGVGVACIKDTGNRRRINVYGEEEVAGKLRRVRPDGGIIISQTAHSNPT